MSRQVKSFKQVRQEKGLTQRRVAEFAGITVQTVSNIERGATSPALNARQFAQICELLDMDIKSLAELLEPTVDTAID